MYTIILLINSNIKERKKSIHLLHGPRGFAFVISILLEGRKVIHIVRLFTAILHPETQTNEAVDAG